MGYFYLVKVNKINIMVMFFFGWFMVVYCVRMLTNVCYSKI